MTILIDADGCPVVDLTLRSAGKKGVPVVILCDTSHRIEREGAQTLVFDKGADSVDFALVNRVKPGDLVVTQDIRFCDALERILSGTSGDQQTECENVSFARR